MLVAQNSEIKLQGVLALKIKSPWQNNPCLFVISTIITMTSTFAKTLQILHSSF